MNTMGHELPGLVEKLFTVDSKPFLRVELHLFLQVPSGIHNTLGATTKTAMVDVCEIRIEIKISLSLFAKHTLFCFCLHGLRINNKIAKYYSELRKMLQTIIWAVTTTFFKVMGYELA